MVFMISSISFFENIKVFVPEARIFLWTPGSAVGAAAVNSNGIKTLLANGVITFFTNGKTTLVNGPRNSHEIYPEITKKSTWLYYVRNLHIW